MCICYVTRAGDILAMAESTSSASAPGTLEEEQGASKSNE